MQTSISKMAIIAPGREEILKATEGPNKVLGTERFREVVGELTLQERHYGRKKDYNHEALLHNAACVIHPGSGMLLMTQGNDRSSMLITGSGRKAIGEILAEKTTGLEAGIAEQVFGECYALSEEHRGPLYVFHTRILMARTQGSVSSLVDYATSWQNPQEAMGKVGTMEKNMILWIADEVRKRQTKTS